MDQFHINDDLYQIWLRAHKMRYAPAMGYRERFVELLADYEVVRFGTFTLKSGRSSPYFINAGQLRTGAAISGLGRAYAERIANAGLAVDFVFGPSYKGVPLAVATAVALSETGRDVGFSFDRKETKDHGEGGRFVGTQPSPGAAAVVVDDVITSGASIRHSVELLREASVNVSGVVIAVDRQERGKGARSTLKELSEDLGVPVLPIVSVTEMVSELYRLDRLSEKMKSTIEAYVSEHGPAPTDP